MAAREPEQTRSFGSIAAEFVLAGIEKKYRALAQRRNAGSSHADPRATIGNTQCYSTVAGLRRETLKMDNSVDIDRVHSRAIVQEIGERLRRILIADQEMSPRLRDQMERLRAMDQPPRR